MTIQLKRTSSRPGPSADMAACVGIELARAGIQPGTMAIAVSCRIKHGSYILLE